MANNDLLAMNCWIEHYLASGVNDDGDDENQSFFDIFLDGHKLEKKFERLLSYNGLSWTKTTNSSETYFTFESEQIVGVLHCLKLLNIRPVQKV